MAKLSYWEHSSFFSNIDVAVVGAGIVGLTSAIYLKKASPTLRVIILERGTLPIGASTRNAGFACFGSMTELMDDLQGRTEEEVFGLVKTRWEGLHRLRQLIGDQSLHYKPLGGYEIFKASETNLFEHCADQIPHFNKILKEVIGQKDVFLTQAIENSGFGFAGIKHMILNTAEGQLNTGAMMYALIKMAQQLDISIYGGIEIQSFDEHQQYTSLITSQGWPLKAKKVLFATNGFTKKLLPQLSVQAARNQVLMTAPLDHLPFKGAFHYDKGYVYFRSVEELGKHRVLLGGGRNLSPEIELTAAFGHTPIIKKALKKLLHEVILPGQQVEISHWWSGILGVGPHKKPIVKMVSPSVAVAVRMGGMGVAIGSAIGQQAADMLREQF